MQALERLVLPAPDRAIRRRRGALAVSLLTHGLALLALVWLMHSIVLPVAPAETSIAMVFAPAAPPAAAPAPAEQSAPEPAVSEPPPQETPPPIPPPTPAVEQPPAPVAPPEKPRQVARPGPSEHPPPHRVAVARPPAQNAAPATSPAPTQGAAAATSMSLAHPVAGMESDRPPVYPEIARRRGEQGRVVLQVNVSADGSPVAVSVAESSGYPTLDAAAQNAVERWRFVPATRGGVSVPAVAEVPVRFRLTNAQ